MYDEIHSYADTHNDSTITLNFMSETDTYNRDEKHIIDFVVSQDIKEKTGELIERLIRWTNLYQSNGYKRKRTKQGKTAKTG